MARYGDIEKDRAIKEALLVLGADKEEDWDGGHFREDGVCEGCVYEITEAVSVLRRAIDLPVWRTICPHCDKWTMLYNSKNNPPPEGKAWRCNECDEGLNSDEANRVFERKGDRKGWNG